MLYFDHNATSLLHPAARQAWLEASENFIGNPSSPHRIGSRADAALTGARERVAALIGCDASDIVWTSGATESNNLAVAHFARSLGPDREIWISAIEHPCVFEASRHYFGRRHKLIPVGHDGVIDLKWLRRSLARRRPGAIAVMAANNETGVIQPWREIRELCHEQKIPFLCDATQWIGKLPAAGLGAIDFVSGSAHKFGGPKGVGFLKCPPRGRVHALLHGGQQEEGRRAGTENVPGVLAMIAAWGVRESALRDGNSSGNDLIGGKEKLRAAFEADLLAAVPGVEIVGGTSPRLWNTSSVVMPDADCRQRWVVKLDKAGFAVSTGSACASGKEEPSHVLAAMGYDSTHAARVLRFSSGWDTTAGDWRALARGVAVVDRELRPAAAYRAKKKI